MNINIIEVGTKFISVENGTVYTIINFMVNMIELSSIDKNNHTEMALRSKVEIEDLLRSGQWVFA